MAQAAAAARRRVRRSVVARAVAAVPDANVSLVLPAGDVVLKLNFPVLAERAFNAVALVHDGPGDLAWRLDYLAAELGLDRERLRRWTIAHTVAWGFAEHEPYVYERQIEVAGRLRRL
jgi:hypothetical protein